MWPFTSYKDSFDYLKDVVALARAANDKIDAIYEGSNPKPILDLLDAILDIDIAGLHVIEKETGSAEIAKTMKRIIGQVMLARATTQQGKFVAAHRMIDTIIEMAETAVELPQQTRKPSRELSRVLQYSPTEALSHGILYRGLSADELSRYQRGLSIYAKDPRSKEDLYFHLVDPTRSNQFISFTTDITVARKFGAGGKCIAVKKNKLRGNVLDPHQIELRIKKDTKARKYVVKNTEFVLEPASGKPAEIPPEAYVY